MVGMYVFVGVYVCMYGMWIASRERRDGTEWRGVAWRGVAFLFCLVVLGNVGTPYCSVQVVYS